MEADFERPLDNFERPFRFFKMPEIKYCIGVQVFAVFLNTIFNFGYLLAFSYLESVRIHFWCSS